MNEIDFMNRNWLAVISYPFMDGSSVTVANFSLYQLPVQKVSTLALAKVNTLLTSKRRVNTLASCRPGEVVRIVYNNVTFYQRPHNKNVEGNGGNFEV